MLDQIGFLREQDESGAAPINYFNEAFLLHYNWITLAAAAAFSLLVLSPLPLLAAMGLELMYLSVVPSYPRFQRWVRSHRSARQRRADEQRLAAAVKQLPSHWRSKYFQLDRTCRGISANYRQLSAPSRILLEQIERTLGVLLQAYIQLLSAAHQHETYLRGTSGEAIREDIDELERGLAAEDPEIQEMNRQRIGILKGRLSKFATIRRNTQIVETQCAAIEDAVKLIHEQSLTLREPGQVRDHLESLMQEVRRTEETVSEVEPLFEADSPIR